MSDGSERSTTRDARADRTQRRRRPSGEPSPLPRSPFAGSGKVWIVLAGLLVVIVLLLLSSTTFFLGSGAWWDAVDDDIHDVVVTLRSDALTDAARALDSLRSEWFLGVLRTLTVVALVTFRRWRHLAVFVPVVLGTELIAAGLTRRMARPRPDGLEILTDWVGFSFPSVPIAALTVTSIAMIYALAVPGRVRHRLLLAASAVITIVGLARIYLGVDRVTDGASAVILGVVIPMLAYRLITPDSVFPVTYRRGKTAHLDVSGHRREAIVSGLRDQLGFEAVSIELFGLEGSGGSTPLRIEVERGGYIFAKVYAQNHLRSDRWYKLGRSLLYGALEDEQPYRTVRRLAEHEDHVMRLMQDAGVPIPEPLGLVELTPGREYLLVTDFVEGAVEASKAVINATVVETALRSVRAMWDAGLAHRDIKPANVLVRGGDIFLIDHAFGEIRPSPWRQAVDLANMMLTLSVRYPTEEVHRIAAEIFTEDEIGEAFAVARSVTIPGELRSAMRRTGRDLLAINRHLAPPRPPIGIQRWTPRRISALLAAAATLVFVLRLLALNRAIVSQLL